MLNVGALLLSGRLGTFYIQSRDILLGKDDFPKTSLGDPSWSLPLPSLSPLTLKSNNKVCLPHQIVFTPLPA